MPLVETFQIDVDEDEFFYGDQTNDDMEDFEQRPRSQEECRSKGEVDKEAIDAINADCSPLKPQIKPIEDDYLSRRRRFQQRKLGSFHYVAIAEQSDGQQ